MLTEHLPRVLLVEDEPQVYGTLLRRLANDGFSVTLARTYDEACQVLETEDIHLAVIDVVLDAANPTNTDGIRVLEHIHSLGLRDILPCIVLTAYGTLPLALKSMDLGVARFIPKQPGRYIADLRQTIQEKFDSAVKIGFHIEYVGESRQSIEQHIADIHEPDAGWKDAQQLIPQVYDVLGKLFHGAKQLWIRRVVKGLSGSIVLEVHPTWQTGLGQSLIVKIGRRDKTLIEQQNYHRHVEHFLPRNHATQINAHYTRHLGALLYTLADTEAADTIEFQDFYHNRSAFEVVAALQGLFRTTCRLWYQGRTAPTRQSLRDLYLDAFYLRHQPGRLHKEIAALRPNLDAHAALVTFEALPGAALPNPLRWLEAGNASVLAVCKSITHGDLNTRNILMNEDGQCWLIDFYRTYESHILRDFVVLETDIKFRLMETLAPELFLKFEQALVELTHPRDGISLDNDLPENAQKAAVVIVGLRAEAWRLLDATKSARHIQQEYLTSLLMATLNVLRLRHFREDPLLQPRRELALLSAALMCQQLQRQG